MYRPRPAWMAGLRPKTVGEWAEDDLTEGEPEEHGRDDELDIVPAWRTEVVTYGRQRRQHRVGRERGERHQQGRRGPGIRRHEARVVRLNLPPRASRRAGQGAVSTISLRRPRRYSLPRNHVARLLKSSGWSSHMKWLARSKMCIWASGMLL